MRFAVVVYVVISALAALACCHRQLGRYKVDRSKISVSGLSSGAMMTVQMHVAYSSVFMGAGVIAGIPYYCVMNNYIVGSVDCILKPASINISRLVDQTRTYAAGGLIDSTDNMFNDRVYVFHGTKDIYVVPGAGRNVLEYYENFVNAGNIKAVLDVAANHTFPTMKYGNPCLAAVPPYISRCNYDAAYELLQHIYGDLTRPNEFTAVSGDFYKFSQAEFFYNSAPAKSSMDDVGFVYVPKRCKSGTKVCKLHVAFHGCSQGRFILGDEYARHTGYNEVAELNDIIIIYPQAIVTNVTNPFGCWDFWGYTDSFYATKNADQPLAVWRMIQKLAYITCSAADRAKSTAVGLVVRCVVAVSAYITVLSLL